MLHFLTESSPGLWLGAAEAALGAILFPALFMAASFGGGRWWRGNRLRVEPGAALDCACKAVSAAFAVAAVAVGIGVVSTCLEENCDLIRSRRPLVRHFMCFGLTYFLYDIWAMFVVFRKTRADQEERDGSGGGRSGFPSLASSRMVGQFIRAKPLLVAHHVVLPLFGFPILMWYQPGLGDCLLSCGFFMEASTPFVSFRAILANLDLQHSTLYLINGVVMLAVFFLCRIVIFPVIYLMYAKQLGKSFFETVTQEVPLVCTLSVGLVLAPQLYWLSLMVKGARKRISLAWQKRKRI